MLKSPSGKIYIGQTIRPIEKRFKSHQHKNSACVAIYNAILKYGWDAFEKDYYECPDEDLNFDEEFLIREMETLAPEGYNLKTGGGNGKHSNESRQKMREAHLGEKSYMFGIPKSDDHKKKNREAHLGEKSFMFGKNGEKNHNSKRVYQYALDGTFIDSFGSTEEAGRYMGKDGTNVRACARGVKGYKTAYGFKWSYIKF